MVEAIERVRGVLGDMTLEAFEADWQSQWLIVRGIEIVSEASRHLTDELKARHPEILWPKVAGIGNVLRHGYESISAPVMWKLVRDELPPPRTGVPRGTGGRTRARQIDHALNGREFM